MFQSIPDVSPDDVKILTPRRQCETASASYWMRQASAGHGRRLVRAMCEAFSVHSFVKHTHEKVSERFAHLGTSPVY